MSIDYDHACNRHTVEGAVVAFPEILGCLRERPRSLVDVGCGTGVWLRAAMENGIEDLCGVDGVVASPEHLVIRESLITKRDLTDPLDVGRRFDVAICLEVAEHLDARHAPTLVDSLVNLADTVVFSAACPGQRGQHHVNCQWPGYWQALFNRHGFWCDDTIRWRIWLIDAIEPWYRQNIFIARRDPSEAGRESRLAPVRHPEIKEDPGGELSRQLRAIECGSMPVAWYPATVVTALYGKASRCLRRLLPRR
jgi:hypothetical protein